MSAREELIARTSSHLWKAWSKSDEDMGSEAGATLFGLGMLVTEGGAAELERLRLLQNAQPAALSPEQIEALEQAGNRAAEEVAHERLCACGSWPERCVSGYYSGQWDSTMADALPALIGVWESMRAPAEAAELARLVQDRAQWRTRYYNESRTYWDAELPPGGECCAVCYQPVESEPCSEHHPATVAARLAEENDRLRARVAELEAERSTLLADRDAQIVAWLGKKAHEYGTSNAEKRAKAEAVGRMADKLSRGAVRPLEDAYTSPLQHEYTKGRDLPEVPHA